MNYCFDRKEAKDHGEGGLFVGKALEAGERVIIVEDVMTSGKALREILPKLKETADVEVAGMVTSVDRMEKGLAERTLRRAGSIRGVRRKGVFHRHDGGHHRGD